MKLKRYCLNCGKKFSIEISKNRIKVGHGKYCSRKCFGEHWSRRSTRKPQHKNRNNWPTIDITLANKSIVHWNRSFFRNHLCWVKVTCGICQRERSIMADKTNNQTFSGLCQKCSRRVHAPKGERSPNWKGGKFISVDGYVHINIRSLSGREYEIASQMARIIHGKPAVISEHRLAMAVFFDRPLMSSEVVHHKNGEKTDNRIGNLEIVSHAAHRQLDVKYYDLWQKALAEIKILKEQLHSPSKK